MDAWDQKQEDERTADTLRTFIIFCEDEHHEPLYFKSFEQKIGGLKVNAIGNQKQRKLNLNNTIAECVRMGLICFENGAYKLQDGIEENLWCVYDRDMETEDPAAASEANNIDFDTAIQTAQAAGLKLAWSNDVFELWILLHFEDVPTENMLNRTYVYSRLTDIFKNILPQNPELEQLTGRESFNYKDNMKRRNIFINQVIPHLHTYKTEAIKRAEALEAHFTTDIPYHRRNPCTMVHHLVQSITGEA